MRVLIVDDEPLAREEMRFLLEEAGGMDIVGEGENGFAAVELARDLKPDLLFLDIQMPGKSGIEAAREICKQQSPPVIIFQTAYDEFAIQAFEVNALDYLVKPVSQERLHNTLGRLKNRQPSVADLERLINRLSTPRQREHKPIPLYAGETIVPLKQQEIIFVEAQGKEVRIVSRRGEFSYHGAFWQVENQLTHPDFIHCHRSYIVNISLVERIDLWVNNTFMLRLSGTDELIPVSRSHIGEFRRRLNL
ncbi:LytTR family DNA-binding domain-containing protein [Marispirochaeta sp.]|uniref:LytR/AlgR family response regulator transcription factor n=1 Tax=Marispirochaeta sp. TaxID=2038653 RepID=UPI0029C8B2AF|nr:LytTR family DNA-binding domain-containing protein [Marispirochaeta sp.]